MTFFSNRRSRALGIQARKLADLGIVVTKSFASPFPLHVESLRPLTAAQRVSHGLAVLSPSVRHEFPQFLLALDHRGPPRLRSRHQGLCVESGARGRDALVGCGVGVVRHGPSPYL